ncbi:MAG: hypothetical protein P1P84_10560 [Deferrisomatales bacterium]|nr:hypothetical protein [Deferrisomatales bacterium]
MKQSGQIAILQFPQADLARGEAPSGAASGTSPGRFDDWLACMISTQVHQAVEGFDEVVAEADGDFASSGLKTVSVIRRG